MALHCHCCQSVALSALYRREEVDHARLDTLSNTGLSFLLESSCGMCVLVAMSDVSGCEEWYSMDASVTPYIDNDKLSDCIPDRSHVKASRYAIDD